MITMETMQEAYNTLYGVAHGLMEGKWAEQINAIREADEKVGEIPLCSTAVMLENLDRWIRALPESTRSAAIGGFIHHGFDLITAVMPSLIANEIVSVQPMTRKIGEIFFMEFQYGSTKGEIASGSTMFGHAAVGNSATSYSSQYVPSEVIGTSDGSDLTPTTATPTWLPLINDASTFTIVLSWTKSSVVKTATADANGSFAAHADIVAGTLTTAGVWSVALQFDTGDAPDESTNITLSYYYNMEGSATVTPMIPEVNLVLTSQAITAQPRKLKAIFTLDASYDLSMAFGKNADVELSSALAGEIRGELDGEIMNDLYANAAVLNSGVPFSWDKTVPSTEDSYQEHKLSFIDKIIEMSNGIFSATRKAEGNFILADVATCNVIQGLAPRFKREGTMNSGPHYLGTLDGQWKVYKNPFWSKDTTVSNSLGKFVVGHNGDNWLQTGYVWAPYLLMYTTPTIELATFQSQKGMASMYGKKLVNGSFYAKGAVIQTT